METKLLDCECGRTVRVPIDSTQKKCALCQIMEKGKLENFFADAQSHVANACRDNSNCHVRQLLEIYTK